MSNFKATTLATLPSIIEPKTDAAKYWQRCLQPAKVAKELAAINCIDINPMHDLLVTSSTRMAVYEYYSMEVKRQYSSPNMVMLFGGHFRSDSKLIAAGASDGIVRVWDVKNSRPLRALGLNDKSRSVKHLGAVRRTHFIGTTKVVSLGDDYNIKLWDITEDKIVSTFGDKTAHEDYIRASRLSKNSSMVISGSYDRTVKVWDHRSPAKAVAQMEHGAPVEAVTVRNLMAISSGGDTVKVFDLVGGKVLKTLTKIHNKTITCVCNFGHFLVTASIDGHLKVYDHNFNVAASLSYSPSQLLSCALDNKVLAVGANDGLFSVNKLTENFKSHVRSKRLGRSKKSELQSDSEKTFNLVQTKIDSREGPTKRKNKKEEQTFVVWEKQKTPRLNKHDLLLKKFDYTSALNRVLRVNDGPDVVVSFMQELIRRRGLKAALAGKNDEQLKYVIDFVVTHLKDPRFNRILVDVALILTDVYMPDINRSDKIQSMFAKLKSVVNSEINCLQQMLSLSGQLSVLVNSNIQ